MTGMRYGTVYPGGHRQGTLEQGQGMALRLPGGGMGALLHPYRRLLEDGEDPSDYI